MPMEFHTSIRATCADPSRPLADQVEDTVHFVRKVASLGTFARLSFQHHWLSYPTVWIEPLPLIARLAPETGNLRLLTSVLKLPIHNPVDLAHQIATVDHITHGRLDIGIGVGYQEEELEAVGASRRERASRLEESVALMQQLWTGEEVTFQGRYWRVTRGQMGYTPVQKPHPPLFVAAYGARPARRAARLGAVLLMAPQATWQSLEMLVGEYDDELGKVGGTPKRGANRNICVARDHETAIRLAQIDTARRGEYYGRWQMNEPTTDMVLSADRDPRDYAIVGTPEECVEIISRQKEKLGLAYMGIGPMNLPSRLEEKLEYFQWVSEEVLSKVRR